MKSFYRSIFAKCLQGVLRACRSKTAGRRLEWGDADLVKSDKEDKRCGNYLLYDFQCLSFAFHGCWVVLLMRARMLSISAQMTLKSAISLPQYENITSIPIGAALCVRYASLMRLFKRFLLTARLKYFLGTDAMMRLSPSSRLFLQQYLK